MREGRGVLISRCIVLMIRLLSLALHNRPDLVEGMEHGVPACYKEIG